MTRWLLVLTTLVLAAGCQPDGRPDGEGATSLEIPGGTQQVWCAGQGPGVVLIHGIGDQASSNQWLDVQDQLAQDARVCRYDRPGTGGSPPPTREDRGPRALALELGAVVDHTTDREVVLVAHSLGGYLARLFAERYPERVRGIVFVDALDPSVGLLRGTDAADFEEVAMADEQLDLHRWRSTRRGRTGPAESRRPGGLIRSVSTTYRLVGMSPVMSADTSTAPARGTARTRILEAALQVIRERGLHATTVDDLCAVAGVTKGAIFHHFKSKDDLAVAAAEHWHSTTGEMFAGADYHRLPTPWQRLMGYLDLRAGWIEGATAEYTCLVGTMVQEAHSTHPQVRDACRVSILGHAATLEAEFALLLQAAPEVSGVTPASLAEHTQTVLQGAFVLAKATGDPDAVPHRHRAPAPLLRAALPCTRQGERMTVPPASRPRDLRGRKLARIVSVPSVGVNA